MARLDERDKVNLTADAGTKTAIMLLKKEPEKAYYSLKDDWSNNPTVFKGSAIGDGTIDIGYTVAE